MMQLPSVEKLLDIGIALSSEKDSDKLFETILDAAMDITHCDGGTLYVLEGEALHFKIMITRSIGIRRGADGERIDLPPVPLSGLNDSSRAAITKKPINIADVYAETGSGYSGTKRYDELNKYRTVSMLTIPMENDYGDIIGVMQLLNAMDDNGRAIPFAGEYERVVLSLASQAAICLTNRNYAAEVTALLDSFVRVMSTAIDARSPYNANHTRNMAKYAKKFITWLNENAGTEPGIATFSENASMEPGVATLSENASAEPGSLSLNENASTDPGSLSFSENRARQFYMSVWLHDIGKLVVPLEVMDKESRLGPKLTDILRRFQIFRMQNEIYLLKNIIDAGEYERRALEITHADELVQTANKAGFLSDGMLAEIRVLSEKKAAGPDGETPYLTNDETVCLTVRKGTLTDDERRIIESHVTMTRRMLLEMDFPKQYLSVPQWASAHHEYINGGGYPDRLAGDAVTPEMRILTILDIYDALTARDRPYKPAVPIEKAFGILSDMAAGGQIDGYWLDLFRRSEAWMD